MSTGEIRGCGGTLRIVFRDLTREELPAFVSSGRRAHAVCEHPDGTAHEYEGVPTPGEQLAHEFPDLADAGDHDERHTMTDAPDAPEETPEPVGEGAWAHTGTLYIAVCDEDDYGRSVPRGTIPYRIESNGEARRAVLPRSDGGEGALLAEWTYGDPESVTFHPIEGVPSDIVTAMHSQLADIVREREPASVQVIDWSQPFDHINRLRRLFYAAELMHRAGAITGELGELVPAAAAELYDKFTAKLVELGPFGAPAAKALSQLRKSATERARIDAGLAALVAVPADADLIPGVLAHRNKLIRSHDYAEAAEHDAMNTLTIALKGA